MTSIVSSISPCCGSYLPSDVTLLLSIIDATKATHVDPKHKERLIQSGQAHYSDMLTLEQPPSKPHEALYYQALAQGKQRMATEIASLAYTLCQVFQAQVSAQNPLIMVSLVRAGLPVGVLLQRALSDSQSAYALPSRHYGVSIIRNRGIDPIALDTLVQAHPNSPIVFVDGWTGKGAIYRELQQSLTRFINTPYASQIFHQGQTTIPLVTLADPAGVAWLSASGDDWLMPASLLNSTVSGLISRTLYRDPMLGLHQAVFYQNLQDCDKSLEFIEVIDKLRQQVAGYSLLPRQPQPSFATGGVIEALAKQFAITNLNRIKPTIAEATRAILRRDPQCVLLNDAKSGHDTALLRHLCADKQLPVIETASIAPYQAVTIIHDRSDT